jgi:serine protease Do
MHRFIHYLLVPMAALALAAALAMASPEPPKTPLTGDPAKTASTGSGQAATTAAEPVKPVPTTIVLDAAKAVETAIEQAASRVGPAVVNIITVREVTAASLDDGSLGPDVPPDVRDFLNRMRNSSRPSMRMQGNGSGSIISADGYILTSEHVIRDATDIKVTLSTRKKYPAKVIGADPRRDLAVIKIDAKDLPVAKLGDAATLKRGQFVLALGSPFGFGRDGQASLSFGIVSGTGRAIPGVGREVDRYYGNLVQTDAAVNPGNSGGPLINLDGEVVGVNAVISSQSGSSEGVGFAVPIMADTRRIIDRLKKGEEVIYGYLGIQIADVSEDDARVAGLDAGTGAYITEVVAGTPAAKAGLKTGDIVLSVDNSPVHGSDDVIQTIQATPVGDVVTVTILRKGKEQKIDAEVARRPAAEDMLAVGGPRDTGASWRGMRLEPLTEELRQQTALKATDRGAFVKEVKDGSPAADAGLVPGMVIDQVGDKRVASVREFTAAVTPSAGPVTVHIIGLGTKIIPAPDATKPDTKASPTDTKAATTDTKAAPTDTKAASTDTRGAPDTKTTPGKTKTKSPVKTPPAKSPATPTADPATSPTAKPVATQTGAK